MSKPLLGRDREIRAIHQANRAAAVGQLMLGELNSWEQFLKVETHDLNNLPRSNLKAGIIDVKKRLSKEIKKFCLKNFLKMNEKSLSLLYEEVKAYRGLELPLSEFEEKFSPVNRKILKGNPIHATVCISLWGLQFRFPEDDLSKDLISALLLASNTNRDLNCYRTRSQTELKVSKKEISSLIRNEMFAARSAFLCCFNLIEAYLMGLAWDYMKTSNRAELSNRKQKFFEDTTSVSLHDKLRKYPEIITNKVLWKEPDEEFDGFMNTLKPYRDSLIHPSPFSTPERFGGYNKLRMFYRIDFPTAITTAKLLVRIIRRVHEHVYCDVSVLPPWICELESEVNKIFEHS